MFEQRNTRLKVGDYLLAVVAYGLVGAIYVCDGISDLRDRLFNIQERNSKGKSVDDLFDKGLSD